MPDLPHMPRSRDPISRQEASFSGRLFRFCGPAPHEFLAVGGARIYPAWALTAVLPEDCIEARIRSFLGLAHRCWDRARAETPAFCR